MILVLFNLVSAIGLCLLCIKRWDRRAAVEAVEEIELTNRLTWGIPG